MATNEGFDGDPGLGFSHLLESGNGGGVDLGFDLGGGGDQGFMYSSSFPSLKPPTMLCFSSVCSNKQKSISDSSSASSSNNSSCTNSIIINNNNNKSKRRSHIDGELKTEDERRNGLSQDFDMVLPVLGFSGNGDVNGRTSSNKKPKKEKPAISKTRPVKARKEKLGERITALQQLVSPFGKTDTASVLHEAMGYIRFLHDQVQVLSSPYLQNMPSSFAQGGGRGNDEKMMMKKMKKSSYSSSSCCGGDDDLRSRGLCLVPVEYTVHVADCNGADLWSPAAAMGRSSTTRPSSNNNNLLQPLDGQLKDP